MLAVARCARIKADFIEHSGTRLAARNNNGA